MNRILIMALVVLLPAMMQACKGDKNGKVQASAEAQSAQPEQLANVAFLKSLDLDLNRVAIGATFDTKFLLTEEGEKKRVQLNEHQIDALLDDAPVDFDWYTAMKRLATLPRQEEWEKHVAEFQNCSADATSDEKWQMMERMFYLYE